MSNKILECKNIYYFNKHFYLKNNQPNLANHFDKFVISNNAPKPPTQTIENMFVITTLNFCYSHAIMDTLFPYYWAVQDIRAKNPEFKNFTCFIREKSFVKFKKFNRRVFNVKCNRYKGVWNELMNILTPNIIFEKNINQCILIKNCYFYTLKNDWQRTVWNSIDIYPGRNVKRENVLYSDEIIYSKLRQFIKHVKNKYQIKPKIFDKKEAIIIERKNDRKWCPEKLKNIIQQLKNNPDVIFKGVKILEDMTFKEQVILFSSNNLFVFRHGSCLINLLWAPENSTVFDVDIQTNRKNIVRRVAKATNSTTFRINYNGHINLNSSLSQ